MSLLRDPLFAVTPVWSGPVCADRGVGRLATMSRQIPLTRFSRLLAMGAVAGAQTLWVGGNLLAY